MAFVKSRNDYDCFRCAFAQSEGLPYNNRRVKRVWERFRIRGKRIRNNGASSKKITSKGIQGYTIIENGTTVYDLGSTFKYKTGIVCVFPNDSKIGHAVYWNGWRVVCSGKGSLHNSFSHNFITLLNESNISLNTVMIKDDVNILQRAFNAFMCGLSIYFIGPDEYKRTGKYMFNSFNSIIPINDLH